MIKLSEIKGEKSIDILADLVEPVASIAADETAAELFGRRDLPEGMTVREYVIKRLKSAVPALLKNHKVEIVRIFSALSDMTEDEYREQLTLAGVISDLSDIMTDPIFNAFFTMPQSTGEYSGSASESTEG